ACIGKCRLSSLRGRSGSWGDRLLVSSATTCHKGHEWPGQSKPALDELLFTRRLAERPIAAESVSLLRRNWCVPGCMELGLADLGDDGGVGCGAIGDLLLVRRSAIAAMDCDLLAMLFGSVDEC
ncbi:unnamed protein product, partial [Symbiodinium microadriaticum]